MTSDFLGAFQPKVCVRKSGVSGVYLVPEKRPTVSCRENDELGGGFKYFLFSPLFGEDSRFDEHIFQMG